MTVVDQVWYVLMETVFIALTLEVWFDAVKFPSETIMYVFIADIFGQIDFIL